MKVNEHRSPTVEEIISAAAMSADEARQLTHLHDDAFEPEERQFTAKYIIEHAGRNGFRLLVMKRRGEIVAYLFSQIKPDQTLGYLWYVAVDRSLRGSGFGTTLMQSALNIIRRDHPAVPFVLLESHCPAPDEPADGINRRRIEFYRRLGAHHVTGIDYGVPAADDPTRLIYYDILFFQLAGDVSRERVRAAIADMMRNNFNAGDDRLKPMFASLDAMDIVPSARKA